MFEAEADRRVLRQLLQQERSAVQRLTLEVGQQQAMRRIALREQQAAHDEELSGRAASTGVQYQVAWRGSRPYSGLLGALCRGAGGGFTS